MRKQDGEVLRPAGRRRLDQAIWQARIAQAEHSDVVADLRAGELARLALVEDEVRDLAAQLPQDCDQFEFALVPGSPPRFWVDMVSFVVMDRDRKTYRFARDTSLGRQLIAESADPAEIGARITDYVAHRIIERERALAVPAGYVGLAAEPGAPAADRQGFSLRALVVTFLAGLGIGAAVLLAWGIVALSWLR